MKTKIKPIDIAAWLCGIAIIAILRWYYTGPVPTSVDESDLLIAKVDSPNGLVTATINQTNGGATTGFGYRVMLRPAHGSSFLANLNSFDQAEVAYLYNSFGPVDLNWIGPDELNVQYLSCPDIMRSVPEATVAWKNYKIHLVRGVRNNDSQASSFDIVRA